MTATFQINQGTTGTPGVSRRDLALTTPITLHAADVSTSYLWEVFSYPEGSSFVLTGETLQDATLVLDVTGGYLVRLTVNDGLPTKDIATLYLGVPLLSSALCIPAFNETSQDNSKPGEPAGYERKLTEFFKWVDNAVSGITADSIYKETCRVAIPYWTGYILPGGGYVVGDIYTAPSNGTFDTGCAPLDGVSGFVVGDKILMLDESTYGKTGIWEIIDAGSAGTPYRLQRAETLRTVEQAQWGSLVKVTEGSKYGGTVWRSVTKNPADMDEIVWEPFNLLADLTGALGTSVVLRNLTGTPNSVAGTNTEQFNFVFGEANSITGTCVRNTLFGDAISVATSCARNALFGASIAVGTGANNNAIFGSGHAIAASGGVTGCLVGGASHTLDMSVSYSVVAGYDHSVIQGSEYSAVFGTTHSLSGAGYGLVFGQGNTMAVGDYGLVGGAGNSAVPASNYVVLLGSSNSITATGCDNSVVFGNGNTFGGASSTGCLVTGNSNAIGTVSGGPCISALITGSSNQLYGGATGNVISGGSNVVSNGSSYSVITGSSNTLDGGSAYNYVPGSGNSLTNGCSQNIVSNSGNYLYGSSTNILMGSGNNLYGSSANVISASGALIRGSYNLLLGSSSHLGPGSSFSVVAGTGIKASNTLSSACVGSGIRQGAFNVGASISFSITDTTVTLTDSSAPFTSEMDGRSISVSNATTSGNNGFFGPITYVSSTQVTYTNASGATETGDRFTTFALSLGQLAYSLVGGSNIAVMNTNGCVFWGNDIQATAGAYDYLTHNHTTVLGNSHRFLAGLDYSLVAGSGHLLGNLQYSVVLGSSHTVSYAADEHSNYNTVLGAYNLISGTASYNLVTGYGSVINDATSYSTSLGRYSRNFGGHAYVINAGCGNPEASDIPEDCGWAQNLAMLPHTGHTVDDTPTEIFMDGSSAGFIHTISHAYSLTTRVIAFCAGTRGTKTWEIRYTVRHDLSEDIVTISDPVYEIINETAEGNEAAWDVDIASDGAYITVTGASGEVINWQCDTSGPEIAVPQGD